MDTNLYKTASTMNSKSFIGLLLLFTGGGFIGYGVTREPEVPAYVLLAGFILLGTGGFLFGSLFGKNKPLGKSPVATLVLLYAGFTLLGVYQLAKGNPQDAMSSLGIALAFDPFDPKVTWKQRPIWQKMWLVFHLTLVLFLLAGMLSDAGFIKDMQAGFRDGFRGQ